MGAGADRWVGASLGSVSGPRWVVSGGPGRPTTYRGPIGLDPVLSPFPKVGSSSIGPSSLEGSRRFKALEAIGAPGLARMDDCRGVVPAKALMPTMLVQEHKDKMITHFNVVRPTMPTSTDERE